MSRSLELPDGYQRFDWYTPGKTNEHGVTLNDPKGLMEALRARPKEQGYFYTSHQIYYSDGLIKQTRSSPNWEGGIVTYATCKHLLRCTKRLWKGVWIATVGPKECEENTLITVGRISKVFASNASYGQWMGDNHHDVAVIKQADTNPRADIYRPRVPLLRNGHSVYDHNTFYEPPNHTRSVDFYKKSPGSTSERGDGLIPKWWRDMEYVMHGRRPPVFILSPCWIFSEPILWSTLNPGRASLKITAGSFEESLEYAF